MAEGALVGVLFQELVNLVKDVKQKSSEFNSILDGLEETLLSISPTIKEIQDLNVYLDRPKTELQPLVNLLEEGKQLVEKSAKVPKWDIYRRNKFWSKITELEVKILRFFNLNMRAQSSRNILQILVGVTGLSRKFDRLSSTESSLGGSTASHTMLDSPEVPDEPVWTVGLEQPLKELKMIVFSSEEIITVLSAPGGSGKTTLVNELRKDVDVKDRFRTNIFFVTVSKAPNVMAIIQTLLQQMCVQAPDFQSENVAFNHLKVSLKSLEPVPVLCILDDVWPGSDSLLESFEFNQKGFKLLVTSRSVFPRFHSTYRLNLLSDADAMTLFRKSAFFQNGNPNFIDKDLLKKIVGKCKNNPLALKVIGKSLKGEPAEVWEYREKNWFQSVFSVESQLLASLRASLDSLDKKGILKDCFFDLASFPEDSRIPITSLVDMWVERYKLEDEVFAVAHLHELSNRCLVDLVRNNATEVYWGYSGNFITQHDILRELALHQSMQDPVEQRRRLIIEICGNHIPEWLLKQKCHATEARLLSISTDEEFTSNWWDMELPAVEVLLLSLRSRHYELPKFVKTMEELRALVITNHGVCHTQLSNFLVLGSLSNLRRIRLENVSVPSIFKSCSQHEPVESVISRMLFSTRLSSLLNNYTRRDVTSMKNLKKISLMMCNIGQAFSNCPVQLSEILPALEEIHIDYCNDLVELPSQVCDLGKLKKVSITNCPKLTELPERFGDLGATLEVLILQACTELRELPTSIGRLRNLTILDISECLSLMSLPEQMREMKNLRKLHVRGCTSLSKLPASISYLTHLKDVYCDEETAILWEPYLEFLLKLRVIILQEIVNLNWLR